VDLKGYPSQGPYLETLRLELFYVPEDKTSFWTEMSVLNSSFFAQGSEKWVRVLEERPRLTYKLWMQDGMAPLAVIIPGFGGHFTSGSATALANLLYKNGYSVAAISNAFNYEFMESAGKNIVPGYTPADAKDVHNALKKVIKDIERRYGKERISDKSLLGMSLGGLHTLYVSKLEEKDSKPVGFDRYLAINPPVDLLYAMNKVDHTYAVWFPWSRKKLKDKVHDAGLIYMAFLSQEFPLDAPLPISRNEAEFLIGISFHIQLRETIFSIHKRKDFGFIKAQYSWFDRTNIYKEIDQFSFYRYIDTFVLKNYYDQTKKKPTIEALNKKAGLRAIGKSLAANPKVRVIHNINDFLVNDSDLKWLHKTLDEKITFFSAGGHLGNLYRPEVQSRILEYMKDKAFCGIFEIAAPKVAKYFNAKEFTYTTEPF
jgi:predicted alpha/beta-fold hydrolase